MILLDTHALIWFVDKPQKLSKRARQAIYKEIKAENRILVSSISVWEIYLLVKKGKLELEINQDAWLEKIESLVFLQFIPIDNNIAAKSVTLPNTLHADPADRIIAATALEYGANLVTSDKKIHRCKLVKTLW